MADVVWAGVVEHLSGVPYVVPAARWGCRLHDQGFLDGMIHALHCGSHLIPYPETGFVDETHPPLSNFCGKSCMIGRTAELIAYHLNTSREEMDEVALRNNNAVERTTGDGSLISYSILSLLREVFYESFFRF